MKKITAQIAAEEEDRFLDQMIEENVIQEAEIIEENAIQEGDYWRRPWYAKGCT